MNKAKCLLDEVEIPLSLFVFDWIVSYSETELKMENHDVGCTGGLSCLYTDT